MTEETYKPQELIEVDDELMDDLRDLIHSKSDFLIKNILNDSQEFQTISNGEVRSEAVTWAVKPPGAKCQEQSRSSHVGVHAGGC